MSELQITEEISKDNQNRLFHIDNIVKKLSCNVARGLIRSCGCNSERKWSKLGVELVVQLGLRDHLQKLAV